MTPDALRNDLGLARSRTNALWVELDEKQLTLPYLTIVNPVLWEVGHVAWFQEYWILRHLGRKDALLSGCDALYDSARVAHRSRWSLPLPSRQATAAYLDRTLDRVFEATERESDPYFFILALFHEDMHAEAMTYTRQTIGLAAPQITPERTTTIASGLAGEIQAGGGEIVIGASPADGFFFDNEKWAHPVTVPRFSMDAAPVTNRQFVEFVESLGYEERRH